MMVILSNSVIKCYRELQSYSNQECAVHRTQLQMMWRKIFTVPATERRLISNTMKFGICLIFALKRVRILIIFMTFLVQCQNIHPMQRIRNIKFMTFRVCILGRNTTDNVRRTRQLLMSSQICMDQLKRPQSNHLK